MLIKDILAELAKPGEKVSLLAKRIDGVSEKKLGKSIRDAGYSFDNRTKVWSYTGEGEEPLDRSIFDYVNRSAQRQNTKSISNTQVGNVDVQPIAHEQGKIEVPTPIFDIDVRSNTHGTHFDSDSNVQLNAHGLLPGGSNVRSSTRKINKMAIQSRSGKVLNVRLASRREQTDVRSDAHGTHMEGELYVNYSKLMLEELQAIRGLLQTGGTKDKGIDKGIAPDNLFECLNGLNRAANKNRKTFMIDEDIAERLDQFAKEKRVTKSDLLEVALQDLFERYS